MHLYWFMAFLEGTSIEEARRDYVGAEVEFFRTLAKVMIALPVVALLVFAMFAMEVSP